jgi:ribosomal protein L10
MPQGDFEGQIVLAVGRKNPSRIAKLLKDFHQNSLGEKLAMKLVRMMNAVPQGMLNKVA